MPLGAAGSGLPAACPRSPELSRLPPRWGGCAAFLDDPRVIRTQLLPTRRYVRVGTCSRVVFTPAALPESGCPAVVGVSRPGSPWTASLWMGPVRDVDAHGPQSPGVVSRFVIEKVAAPGGAGCCGSGRSPCGIQGHGPGALLRPSVHPSVGKAGRGCILPLAAPVTDWLTAAITVLVEEPTSVLCVPPCAAPRWAGRQGSRLEPRAPWRQC